MFNPFVEIVKGFKWLGEKIGLLPEEIAKVITVTEDVRQDAQTLCPEAVTLISDATNLAEAAVKDSGAALTALGELSAAVLLAAASKGVNVSADAGVVAAGAKFAEALLSHGNWADVINGLHQVVVDAGTFGASAKAALEKLEADAGA